MSDIQSGAGRGPDSAAARSIADELSARFALPATALRVQRATRLWVEADQQAFAPIFDHLVKAMGFSILCTITGLDLGADLGLIYHLARDGDKSAGYVGGMMVNLKTRVPKGQPAKSVTPYFPGAAIYEREVEDLLGAVFTGRPDMPRYPLPEDWPAGDHPLLKDWKPKDIPASTEGAANV